MATSLIGGAGIGLGLGALGASKNNLLALAAGQSQVIPQGQWQILPGPYTFLQFLDPISGRWTNVNTTPNAPSYVSSDGANFRLANLTGTPVGALLTNCGSAYTSAPAIAASAGGSTWKAIMGQAVSGTVTITTAGAGYTYPPQLLIGAPPTGGVQATATCTLSAGAINAVTVNNQGGGYTSVPPITVVPDPRDVASGAITTAAVLTGALAASGTVNAVICTNPGTVVTSLPTLTFTGGGGSSAAATVVMCWSVTGYSVGTAGVAYGTSQPILTLGVGVPTAGSAGAVVNPQLSTGLFTPRNAQMISTGTSGGALTTGGVFSDSGLFQAAPTSCVLACNAAPTTQAVATFTVGGVTDYSFAQPIQ